MDESDEYDSLIFNCIKDKTNAQIVHQFPDKREHLLTVSIEVSVSNQRNGYENMKEEN